MKIRDVDLSEIPQILDMYQESCGYGLGYTTTEFCEDLLTRCECCKEIHYIEDCEMVKMWDGQALICCPSCKKETDSDKVFESEEMGVL